jgi:hypothetical protein
MGLLVGERPAWARLPVRRSLDQSDPRGLLGSQRSSDPSGCADVPPKVAIGGHERELTRLASLVAATYRTSQPARAFRVTAATGAYDLELVQACHTLGIDAPDSRPPLPPQVRFETESRLLAAGLRW